MLLHNKKLAKVPFFLFLFFSFLALGFTICNSVSAYTSADMPEGYRLVSQEDVGKTFGVDLENVIYFDTSIHFLVGGSQTCYLGFNDYLFSTDLDAAEWTNGIYRNVTSVFFKYSTDSSNELISLNSGSEWSNSSLDLSTYTTFVSYPFTIDYVSTENNFIYVKDIERLTLIESILSLFNKMVIWIPSALTGLIALFYSTDTGLTFLGALAVTGLAISVIFLLISIIQNFLHFRG